MKKLPKIKLIIVGIFLLLAIAFIHYISKKLPPSNVTLTFQGWKIYNSNAYAIFCLSNSGPRTLYYNLDGEAIFETDTGWCTNWESHFSYVPLGTPPGSNEIVSEMIAKDAKRWKVRVYYSSYQKHNFGIETFRKFDSGGIARSKSWPQIATGCIWSVLSLFPTPQVEYHEIYSDIFTNKPPVAPIESAKSP